MPKAPRRTLGSAVLRGAFWKRGPFPGGPEDPLRGQEHDEHGHFKSTEQPCNAFESNIHPTSPFKPALTPLQALKSRAPGLLAGLMPVIAAAMRLAPVLLPARQQPGSPPHVHRSPLAALEVHLVAQRRLARDVPASHGDPRVNVGRHLARSCLVK